MGRGGTGMSSSGALLSSSWRLGMTSPITMASLTKALAVVLSRPTAQPVVPGGRSQPFHCSPKAIQADRRSVSKSSMAIE